MPQTDDGRSFSLDLFEYLHQHEFAERLAFSEGIGLDGDLEQKLLDGIAGSTGVRKATTQEDRNGTDYWIDRRGLPSLSVDVKHRSYCPIEKFQSDDACIETCSVYTGRRTTAWEDAHRLKPGWTINPDKRTDYICYTWPARGGRIRFWIVDFHYLCRAAQLNWRRWADRYHERAASNDGYLTLSVYPPRTEIKSAIDALTSGEASRPVE